ncbi:hypothetical protein DFH07DRAFT_802104 [Mycena maculata]|uniref:Uncharacterized protein n=1 Tax=Mycena maculata TaxID=230809 RepID=A0AAD7JW06_9AGAR|nr:hypothetical protein DFH07DRAFT_802104 [Mycena maculata]
MRALRTSTSRWATRGTFLLFPSREYNISALELPKPFFPVYDPTIPPLERFAPLHKRGWEIVRLYQDYIPEDKIFSLRRWGMKFQTLEQLQAFTQNRPDAIYGHVYISPNLEAWIQIKSPEGLTRNLIDLAAKTEAEYVKVVGPDVPVPKAKTMHRIKSPDDITIEQIAPLFAPTPPWEPVSIVPVPLPPAPPMPASPPPALTQADIDTYLVPLITNGWVIRGMSIPKRFLEARAALKGHATLNRAFRFTDYAPAREFLQAAVTAMHAPAPGSFAGIQIRMSSTFNPVLWKVLVYAISELAPGAPRIYGISLADVCFAIRLDNEFNRHWIRHAENNVIPDRFIPKTAEELYSHRTG